MMTINYDGTVALCCGTYRAENMLGEGFLDASHEELQECKYQHEFCKACYENGLHDLTGSEAGDDTKGNLREMRGDAVAERAMARVGNGSAEEPA